MLDDSDINTTVCLKTTASNIQLTANDPVMIHPNSDLEHYAIEEVPEVQERQSANLEDVTVISA